MFTYVFLRVLHVAAIAVWFGLVLGFPGLLKRGQRSGPDAFRLAAEETARRLKLALIFGGVSLATGLIMIFHMGGFGVIHRNIHSGLGIVVVSLAVLFFATRPAVNKLVRLSGDSSADLDSARPSIVRVAISSGVFQLLWLVTLVLMYWR